MELDTHLKRYNEEPIQVIVTFGKSSNPFGCSYLVIKMSQRPTWSQSTFTSTVYWFPYSARTSKQTSTFCWLQPKRKTSGCGTMSSRPNWWSKTKRHRIVQVGYRRGEQDSIVEFDEEKVRNRIWGGESNDSRIRGATGDEYGSNETRGGGVDPDWCELCPTGERLSFAFKPGLADPVLRCHRVHNFRYRQSRLLGGKDYKTVMWNWSRNWMTFLSRLTRSLLPQNPVAITTPAVLLVMKNIRR